MDVQGYLLAELIFTQRKHVFRNCKVLAKSVLSLRSGRLEQPLHQLWAVLEVAVKGPLMSAGMLLASSCRLNLRATKTGVNPSGFPNMWLHPRTRGLITRTPARLQEGIFHAWKPMSG